MIYWFSGTGNSRWAATELAAALDERLFAIADIVCGKAVMPQLESDDEPVGLVFPVNGWMPPAIVRRFVRSQLGRTLAGRYVYTVMTCGDDVGLAMRVLDSDLRESTGRENDARFTLVMPESYVCLPFFNVDSEERRRQKISDAREDISAVADMVRQRRGGLDRAWRGRMPWLKTCVLGKVFNSLLVTDRPFRVDARRCSHCGLCAKVCPVGNVSYDGDRLPVWKKDKTCTNCMACYHHCPHHAINYWTTRHKGQYVFRDGQ